MAAISKVALFNMACSHVGARSTIEAEDEASAEASQCRLWYDRARRQALEAYNWDFARRRLTLALHGDAPPAQWGYRYQYPATAVAIRLLWNPVGDAADAVPYEIELDLAGTSKSILTNLQEAVAIYTSDLETVTLFSENFAEALGFFLASKIAFALTGQQKIVLQTFQMAQGIIAQAAALAGNQSVSPPPREAEWIRGR